MELAAEDGYDAERTWHYVATEFTVVFPPGEEPDIAIVRRIRNEFDPYYVPLGVRKAYKDPSGEEIAFFYHVIGRWAAIADDPTKEPVKLERPTRLTPLFPFTGGVVYDQRTLCDEWAQGTKERALGCPPLYVPFDQRLYEWMNAAHRWVHRDEGSLPERQRAHEQKKADQEVAAIQKVEAEARHSIHSDRYMIRRAIEENRLSEDPPPDPKPYVQAETVLEGEPS